jgi:hypothetical protein
LFEDLDLSQSHFPLKKEASNQGIKEQKNPVALTPVPSEAFTEVTRSRNAFREKV